MIQLPAHIGAFTIRYNTGLFITLHPNKPDIISDKTGINTKLSYQSFLLRVITVSDHSNNFSP